MCCYCDLVWNGRDVCSVDVPGHHAGEIYDYLYHGHHRRLRRGGLEDMKLSLT